MKIPFRRYGSIVQADLLGLPFLHDPEDEILAAGEVRAANTCLREQLPSMMPLIHKVEAMNGSAVFGPAGLCALSNSTILPALPTTGSKPTLISRQTSTPIRTLTFMTCKGSPTSGCACARMAGS